MEKIPNEIIEKIRTGNEIVNVVSQYVKLEKQGRNYFGLCPFHSEKTPSFSVSPEKGIFHCFSCGEGGDVIQFLSKIENISYVDSLKQLANNMNLNIGSYTETGGSNSVYYQMNKFVSDYYRFALLNTSEGKKALEYLYDRGIDDVLIKHFKIGLAPDSTDSLYQALKGSGFSELAMTELGHVTKSKNKYYDKFKNRVMFPIADELGNIVGFSGRLYEPSNTNEPKYINTQETPVFKKGEIVYNLDSAKKAIREQKKVYLFEGFMDVIASYKSGLEASVATMGTALTDEHIRLLLKYTRHIVLCYDGDEAGIEATKRAIGMIAAKNTKVSVINLPEGLDPDEYVKKYGSKAYLDFISHNEKSYKEYMYTEYYKNVNFSNIPTIETFKRQVFALLEETSPTEKELFINKLSGDIHVSSETLTFDLENYLNFKTDRLHPGPNDVKNQEKTFKRVTKNRPLEKKLLEAEEIIVFMCLNERKYVNIVNNNNGLRRYHDELWKIFFQLSEYYKLYGQFDEPVFLENFLIDGKSREVYFNLRKKHNEITYTEKNLEECFTVITNEMLAQYILTLKTQFKFTENEADKLKISSEIVKQIANYQAIKKK